MSWTLSRRHSHEVKHISPGSVAPIRTTTKLWMQINIGAERVGNNCPRVFNANLLTFHTYVLSTMAGGFGGVLCSLYRE